MTDLYSFCYCQNVLYNRSESKTIIYIYLYIFLYRNPKCIQNVEAKNSVKCLQIHSFKLQSFEYIVFQLVNLVPSKSVFIKLSNRNKTNENFYSTSDTRPVRTASLSVFGESVSRCRETVASRTRGLTVLLRDLAALIHRDTVTGIQEVQLDIILS
jgi:hypothetical protein